MKFINHSSSEWDFVENPFPKIEVLLDYGQNKKSFAFIPVKAEIKKEFSVKSFFDGRPVKVFKSQKEAFKCAEGDREEYLKIEKPEFLHAAGFQVSPKIWLEDDQFKVIKTKEKGTIMIVPGEDRSDRALVFVGVCDGFRGGSAVLANVTTATILKCASAHNATKGSTQVAALMEPGQKVVFESFGRRNNDVVVFEWNDGELTGLCYTIKEWETLNEASQDVEEL